jgi:hypothetical protein
MSGPKVPKPANPTAVADSQFQYGQQAQNANIAANRLDQTTPFGSLNYGQTGTDQFGNPTYELTSGLSPEIQGIVNSLQGTMGNLGQAVAANYTDLPDFSEAAGTQTKINMDRQLSYLQPYFTQASEQLDNQLRNQGLMPGTTAYDRATTKLRDDQNQSVMSFLNTAQPLAFNQAVQQYNQPLQTISNLMSTTLGTDPASRFVSPPQANMTAPDFVGANANYNQANMQRYQAQLAQHNAMLTGAFGIGKTLMGMPM